MYIAMCHDEAGVLLDQAQGGTKRQQCAHETWLQM